MSPAPLPKWGVTQIALEVPGIPAPQGSKRFLGKSGGKGIMVESSKRVAPWRTDIRGAAEKAVMPDALDAEGRSLLWHGSVLVILTFRFPRPASHFGTGRNADVLKPAAPRYPDGTRNDLDKLARAVLDALTGIVWADDGHVVGLFASKIYASPGNSPGVSIVVKEG